MLIIMQADSEILAQLIKTKTDGIVRNRFPAHKLQKAVAKVGHLRPLPKPSAAPQKIHNK